MACRLVRLVQLTNMCHGFHGGVSVSVSNLQLLGTETARHLFVQPLNEGNLQEFRQMSISSKQHV